MLILTEHGVEFGGKIGFVPWASGVESPKILVPRLVGYNVVTEWDVRLRLALGDWGDFLHQCAVPTYDGSDHLTRRLRVDVDWAERHAVRRGRPLTVTWGRAASLRDEVGSGRLTITQSADSSGIGRTLAHEILAGRAYWWAGGGSPSWEGFR